MSRTLMLSLAALASLALAATALGSASRSATSTPSLYVQPGTVAIGGAVHVYGNAGSCAPGSKLAAISFAFPESGFGGGALFGRVRANHKFSIRSHVRGNVTAGTYSVTARCGGGNLGVSANVTVK